MKGDLGPPYVSELVADARERRGEAGWAHLHKLDRNSTPCPLRAKLQPECGGIECTKRVGQDPERDEDAGEHNEDDGGETAAEELRHGAYSRATAMAQNGQQQ
jgi:hypothetical protein